MNSYTVQLTLSIDADNEQEAWKLAAHKLDSHDFDSDQITIELENQETV